MKGKMIAFIFGNLTGGALAAKILLEGSAKLLAEDESVLQRLLDIFAKYDRFDLVDMVEKAYKKVARENS